VFEEVIKDEKLIITMDEKMASIEKNDTWELVPRPSGKKSISVKWIYKEKKNVKEKGGEVQSEVSGKRL
jgi:hypothetical protein